MSESSNQASSFPALGGMSDQEIFALIERAQTDPIAARQVAVMQQHCDEMIKDSSSRIAALFAKFEALPDSAESAPMEVRALAAQARSRAEAGKERLALAEQYVIGKLINIGNPDWNPLDPSTSRDADKSAFLALLNWGVQE